MRKARYGYLTFALASVLLAVLVFLPSGAGPGALDSEKAFNAGLHNSLYYLDLAKRLWAKKKDKSEQEVPTMAELTPYLEDWTNRIERFMSLGIDYKITPISEMEHQSDVAILTRDLSFRRGICRFYPAGTRYCIHTGWSHPDTGKSSFRAFYFNNRELLATPLFIFGISTLLGFAVRKIRSSRQMSSVVDEHQNA